MSPILRAFRLRQDGRAEERADVVSYIRRVALLLADHHDLRETLLQLSESIRDERHIGAAAPILTVNEVTP